MPKPWERIGISKAHYDNGMAYYDPLHEEWMALPKAERDAQVKATRQAVANQKKKMREGKRGKVVPVLSVPIKRRDHRFISATGRVKAVVKVVLGKPIKHK